MVDIRHKTFFGRRKGKGMSKAKENLLALQMDKFGIVLPVSGKLNLEELFDFTPLKYIFEIGYGDGEHLVNMAIKNPDIAFIGTEVFLNGNASILKKIIEKNITNIRIFPDDVNLLFPFLPEGGFDRIFILYPDPWPKNRNENRRMINSDNIKLFNSFLKKGGNLFIASDHPVYIPWVMLVMRDQNFFEWNARKSSDFVNTPVDWETTKYEQKAIRESRAPIYLSFTKR